VQVLKVERRRVRMLSQGGTVYDRGGRDLGLAEPGTIWYTVQLEWSPGGDDDPVILLYSEDGELGTWAHPQEFALID